MIPHLYTKKEVSSIIKVSERELMRMIERGEIAYTHRRGCHILFSEGTVETYLKSIEVMI
jgi:excisionase family DNA binding protein